MYSCLETCLQAASGIAIDFPPTDWKPACGLCRLLHAVTHYQPDWAPVGFYADRLVVRWVNSPVTIKMHVLLFLARMQTLQARCL